MRTYSYKKTDAFTSGSSLGNPAACLYLSEDQTLSDTEMLSIARAHKGFVSEVVYCTRNADGSFALRYFSSECEVAFCGHGTIACMAGLIEDDEALLDTADITIHTNDSSLTVYNRMKTQNAVYITAPAPQHLSHNVHSAAIAAALGIDAAKLDVAYPVEHINAGLNTLIVPIDGLDAVVNLFPNEQTLKKFCLSHGADIVLIFCKDTQDGSHITHTRVFAPKFGYLEDPATGSGNSAFGFYMLKHGLWDGSDCSVEQGGCDRLYNVVKLMTLDSRVLFGGGATTRIKGEYYLEG